MKKILFGSILLFSLYSCKTNHVYINVMEPAPVSIPGYIKVAGTVNRSLVSEENKKLNVVDQVLTGEGKNLDKEGAEEAIAGLTDELMQNKRFTEVKALKNVDVRSTGSGIFPAAMPWETIEKICKENSVDAVFSLELFDTDSKISYATIPTTISTPLGNVPAVEHQANMLTTVKTGWRIYDPKSRIIHDEFTISESITFSGRGINPVVAAAGLIGRKDAVKQVGNQVGHSYAERIIPYWIKVTRDYYVKGNSNFERAKRKAQTGNWDEAAELWKKETSNTDDKLAGRACYNMAIICEINGELDMGIEWAKKAYENHNNKLALDYINILKRRQTRDNRLQNQLQEAGQ